MNIKQLYPILLVTLFMAMPALFWWIPLEHVQECRSALVGESWLAGAGMILLKEGFGRRIWSVNHTEHSRRLKRNRSRINQIARILFVFTGFGILLISVVDILLILWY